MWRRRSILARRGGNSSLRRVHECLRQRSSAIPGPHLKAGLQRTCSAPTRQQGVGDLVLVPYLPLILAPPLPRLRKSLPHRLGLSFLPPPHQRFPLRLTAPCIPPERRPQLRPYKRPRLLSGHEEDLRALGCCPLLRFVGGEEARESEDMVGGGDNGDRRLLLP